MEWTVDSFDKTAEFILNSESDSLSSLDEMKLLSSFNSWLCSELTAADRSTAARGGGARGRVHGGDWY
eukprot:COSAG02_NODE_11091_length_1794_cov_2.717404_3_plen_68_part_00